MKTFQIFLLFSFSFSIQSLNGLGVSNDGNEGFFQHVFYEVLDTNGEHEVEGDRNDHEAASISLGDEVRILENSIGLKSAKVISPTLFDSPPPFKEYARMARYVVHHSDWCALANISTRDAIRGSPFANVFSISDGTSLKDASGVPYLYLTTLEMSVKDLNVNNNASLTMSLAQGHYCVRKHLDPEDPRCAHIILTGKIVEVEKDSAEDVFARKALFKRHPEMPTWPEDHGWYVAKLDIASILVLDYFGGANEVTVGDYYKATPY